MYKNISGYEGLMDKENYKDKYFFRLMYSGINVPPSIYYKKGLSGSYEHLISPTSISRKDLIILGYYKASKNDNFLAYQYSRNGSDWNEIKIVQIKKRRFFNDIIKHTKFSDINWFGQGFFYKKFPFDSISGKTIFPKIMYHKLDTPQEQDSMVFEASNENEFLSLFNSEDEDFYIIKKENYEDKTYSFYYLDSYVNGLEFNILFENSKYDLNVISYKNNVVFAKAIINGYEHIISFSKNEPKKWKILTPKYENAVLTGYEFLENNIILSYQSLQNGIITKVDYEGNILNELATPQGLTIGGLEYHNGFKKFFFTLSSYIIPSVQYKLDLELFKYEIVGKTEVGFDPKNYKFSQRFFTSFDGTQVPIFIVFKDSLKTDKNTPFLLKTYGGYGTKGFPRYDPGVVYFLENGGAFAYVNIRGGGELGVNWWESGKKLKKINGIKDFISASEYLIEQGYTRPKKIAITGSSHGGLITASSAIMRPDLFGAAVIDVGVLDMLRFENFTVGATSTNLSEFGTVTKYEEFKNLYSYSPFHNINNAINYPSMLIVTGNHDDRVPPLHSYKFAGRLQNNPSQINPVLLWTQNNTGHYGANKLGDKVEENSYIYGFLFHELTEK